MATEETQCPATIEFGDDYGDNTTTFHCQLPEGHEGDHFEDGVQYGIHPYALRWMGDSRDKGELGFMHGDGQ
jgi:hypothetical protein